MTGVQTCALPISGTESSGQPARLSKAKAQLMLGLELDCVASAIGPLRSIARPGLRPPVSAEAFLCHTDVARTVSGLKEPVKAALMPLAPMFSPSPWGLALCFD